MAYKLGNRFGLPPPAPATEETNREDELLSKARLGSGLPIVLDGSDAFPSSPEDADDRQLVLKAVKGTLRGRHVSSHGTSSSEYNEPGKPAKKDAAIEAGFSGIPVANGPKTEIGSFNLDDMPHRKVFPAGSTNPGVPDHVVAKHMAGTYGLNSK